MKFGVIIVGAIVFLALIGMYFYFLKPQILTPPLLTPPKAPPSLNVYGKLIDYSQNELMTFKIQSEIVNWELNDTYLEIETKPEKLFGQTAELLTCLGFEGKSEVYPSLDEFLQNNDVDEGERKRCEEIIITNLKEKYPECGTFFILDGTERDYNIHEFNLGCNIKFNLIKGDNYVFYFTKILDGEGPWDMVSVSENLTKYKQNGKWLHENDLAIDQMITTEGGEVTSEPGRTTAVRIFHTSIIPNEETEIKIRLINKQDVSIPYRISDVKIVDELIWRPNLRQCQENEQEYQEITIHGTPGEEAKKVLSQVCSIKSSEQRLQESVITNCQINYDASENTISKNSSKIITFKVLCKEPVSCRNWYMSDVYGNVTTECSLILLGDLEFTDELDNIHKKDNTYFRQFLTLSEKASVNVEYSREISSKSEFYAYVDYKDSKGNQIKDAQVEIKFNFKEGIDSMRYDETLERYKFLWEYFYEWDPGYKKGTYSFTITAHKIGYPTIQSGPYYFTLK